LAVIMGAYRSMILIHCNACMDSDW